MVVTLTRELLTKLHKATNKSEAKEIVLLLKKTQPTDGKHLFRVGDVVIRKRKVKSFRFYFAQRMEKFHYLTEEQLKRHIIQFIEMSKKNNQQDVIDALKDKLKDLFK
jgi:hypothetical protein